MSWLGAMPQSAFMPMGQPPAPQEPFVWGQGGARMSPEDIAMQRQLAAQQQQMDYSPIGHWTQGLARVADNIGGALREKRANKASEANRAEADAVMMALMGGGDEMQTGGGDPVAAAMMNPNLPDNVRQFAKMQWERANPKPQAPTEFDRELMASGIMPGTPEYAEAMKKRVLMKTDPEVIVPLPGGMGTYVGPRSGLGSVMGGGGPASTGPVGASPPSTLPPDFDFDKGGPASSAPGRFP